MLPGSSPASVCSRGHRFTGAPPCSECYPGYRTFRFRAEVWLYSGETSAWHFITVPQKTSDTIRKRFEPFARGWGSLRVQGTIGKTSFETSIFPDKKRGGYLLPLKAAIRRQEDIGAGSTVRVSLTVLA